MDNNSDKKFEELSENLQLSSYKSGFVKDLPLPLVKSFATAMKLEIPPELESLLEERKAVINIDQVEKIIEKPRKPAASGAKKRGKGKGKSSLSQEIVDDSTEDDELLKSHKRQKVGVIVNSQEAEDNNEEDVGNEEITPELTFTLVENELEKGDIAFDLGEDL
jgi:hypothetical protein